MKKRAGIARCGLSIFTSRGTSILSNALSLLFFGFFTFTLLSCSMSLDPPRIVSVSVADGQRILDVDSFREVAITFSKPMNCYATERGISLSGYGGGLSYRWDAGNRSVALVLADPFERGNRYVLEIGSGCECAEGCNLERDHSFALFTYAIEEEFSVVSTEPGDGESTATLDGFQVAIAFSLPVEHTTVYDKVSVEPELSYHYAFSEDRKVLVLSVLEHLEPNELYRITVSEELGALSGKRLKETYMFSFNTFMSRDPFRIEWAAMVARGAAPPSIELDLGYLAKIGGVEKDMDLLVSFSADFYLSSIKNLIAVEPAVSFSLKKEGNVIRFKFDRSMVQEEAYRITFSASIKNVYGIALDREYAFEWVVNGEGSRMLKAGLIRVRNPSFVPGEPELFPHIEIYRDGAAVHNQPLLPFFQGEEQRVEFDIVFSAPLDLYRSVDREKMLLGFVYGNTQAENGSLRDYRWEESTRTLALSFSIPYISQGPDAYYKLTIRGGDGGIVDRSGNGMGKDVSVYVKYLPEP